MLIFAHTGITLGAATVIAGAVNFKRDRWSWFASLSRYLDIRFLIIGSLLPDIIDKPVGQYLFRETFNNGRIFSHSLLFLVIISAAGFILHKTKGQVWLLSLAVGTLAHLILDEMWLAPQALFWPFMGFSFPIVDLEGWGGRIINSYFTSVFIIITEAIGLVILIWFGIIVLVKKQAGAFFKRGKIS